MHTVPWGLPEHTAVTASLISGVLRILIERGLLHTGSESCGCPAAPSPVLAVPASCCFSPEPPSLSAQVTMVSTCSPARTLELLSMLHQLLKLWSLCIYKYSVFFKWDLIMLTPCLKPVTSHRHQVKNLSPLAVSHLCLHPSHCLRSSFLRKLLVFSSITDLWELNLQHTVWRILMYVVNVCLITVIRRHNSLTPKSPLSF